MKVVLATRNQGKVRELEAMLAGIEGIKVLSFQDFPEMPDVVENGQTFEENAVKKAREVAEYTNLVAVADDSGLEVDYLNGAPGVYSARFAGENKNDTENNHKLLRLLHGLPMEQRKARFRCVIAIATPWGDIYTTEGNCEGFIGYEMAGDKGFGYDPLFYLPEYDKTFAQLDLEVKNRISHRARALEKAKSILLDIKERIEKETCGLG